MRRSLPLFALLAVMALPSLALAQWSDNFDGYANGTSLHGVGGWAGWDNNPAATGFVTNAQSHSAPHSVDIRPTTDLVQQFTGVNSGIWLFNSWIFVPTGGSGDTYLIFLNTYVPGNVALDNWSLDLEFDQSAGVVRDLDDPGTPTLPLVRGQWVQVRAIIDFTANVQQIFYGNTLFTAKSWTEGASGGGVLNFAAIDLFSNGATSVFWDDLSLQHEGATAVEPATWGSVKATFRR
ncbi:MAG TPA: hypothetical protein VNM87_14890 [Candidatus Udaeobacter sp.]|nr:hypothetical protein [Candidatus Udaeobacter sp.]